MPTSSTTTSTGASANAAKASSVRASKKLSGSLSSSSSSASVMSRNGRMSRQFDTNAALLIGSPSITIRSLTRSRCGLVSMPVRSP